jgi:hypothetical protein
MEFLKNKNAIDTHKDRSNIKIAVAIYKLSDWENLLALKNPTC